MLYQPERLAKHAIDAPIDAPCKILIPQRLLPLSHLENLILAIRAIPVTFGHEPATHTLEEVELLVNTKVTFMHNSQAMDKAYEIISKGKDAPEAGLGDLIKNDIDSFLGNKEWGWRITFDVQNNAHAAVQLACQAVEYALKGGV